MGMWKAVLLLGVFAGAVTLLVVGCKATRAGYESAPYRVVRKAGKFELRDYQALTIVETPMASRESDGSFNRLFRFISGSNTANQKIAMTTPVFMTGSETNSTMAFVMPAKLTSGQVPKPTDNTVRVRDLAAGRFAVFRFSGARNRKREVEAIARLTSWMERERLSEQSRPMFGYFDPPWTPAFLRRNEVMLRTEAAKP